MPPSLPPSQQVQHHSPGRGCVQWSLGWTPHGAWDLEEVLQEEVRPRSGEGGVNADEGVSRADEGERDLGRVGDVTMH